jgi:hypothetical protein
VKRRRRRKKRWMMMERRIRKMNLETFVHIAALQSISREVCTPSLHETHATKNGSTEEVRSNNYTKTI